MYDHQGNITNETGAGAGTGTGAGGQKGYDLYHDALNRLIKTDDNLHNDDFQRYDYDSLGNLVYEKNGNGNNEGNEYWYNELNQQVKKVVDNSNNTYYTYEYDKRGNLIEGLYHRPGKPSEQIVVQYAYGYTNNMNINPNDRVNISNSNGQTQDVVVCDRHANTTGLEHINPTGKGHTEGGTTGATPPNKNHGKYIVVHKDYVLDYTDTLKSVIIETEDGDGNLTYRYVYGLERAHVFMYSTTRLNILIKMDWNHS